MRVATLQAGAEGNRWNVPITAGRPDDVQYVSDVIDHVAARACTDSAACLRDGLLGRRAHVVVARVQAESRIAAIAPMAGLRWPGPCEGRAIPVLTFHGLADPQNTYDGHVEGRGGEWLESVPEALAGWAKHNGCDGEAVLDDPPGPLSTLRYEGCDAEVRLVRIDGLRHAWARDASRRDRRDVAVLQCAAIADGAPMTAAKRARLPAAIRPFDVAIQGSAPGSGTEAPSSRRNCRASFCIWDPGPATALQRHAQSRGLARSARDVLVAAALRRPFVRWLSASGHCPTRSRAATELRAALPVLAQLPRPSTPPQSPAVGRSRELLERAAEAHDDDGGERNDGGCNDDDRAQEPLLLPAIAHYSTRRDGTMTAAVIVSTSSDTYLQHSCVMFAPTSSQ